MKSLGLSFGFVKIPVNNFAAATTFYRDVLGLPEDFAVEEYGWAQYDAGTASICIYVVGKGGGDRPPGGDTGIQLRVNDAKAAHALILSRGGEPEEINVGNDGTTTFSVVDPDGNQLTIAQLPPAE